MRDKTRDENWSEWLSFQQPYPLLLQQFDELRKIFDPIVVCTTKDTRSAQALLASAGLELPIYGKELALHKGEQIKALCQQHAQPRQILFIDDSGGKPGPGASQRSRLRDWPPGVNNTAAERQRALAEGYPVLEVFSLAHDLKTLLNEQCPSAPANSF